MFGPFKFKKTSSILIINGNNDILKIIDDVAYAHHMINFVRLLPKKKKKECLFFHKANISKELIVQIEVND